MTDDELRALVRAAVARHVGGASAARAPAATSDRADWRGHASHGQYLTVINVGDACVIEPDVQCNHCGYCKSHGH
jgi:hypothetical protein